MPEPVPLVESAQLLVDGRDAVEFFRAFLAELTLPSIQVQNYGGNNELRGFLKALRNQAGFETIVRSLKIIRDAEVDAGAAFQSVCSALAGANLPVPSRPLAPVGPRPLVNVLILPESAVPGMLESRCLRAVEDDPAMECIEQYFQCVEARMGRLPRMMPKARVQTFLASRERPGLRLGQAARAGYWPWDSPALQHVRQFLIA